MYFVFAFLLFLWPSICEQKKCETCKDIAKKFKEGMERTSGHNFGGGNTDWEETRLGSWADSETRLVDIIESLCSSTECHSMVEEHEDNLEHWWFKQKSKNVPLEPWLCIDTIKVCCPNGTFGAKCTECPGGAKNPCSNNGNCKGEGSRSGEGICECRDGYTSESCDKCAESHYQDKNNASHLICLECHISCDGGCRDGTAKGCEGCKDGWLDSEEHGCVDKDECTNSDDVCGSKKYCVNTAGSYKCEDCDRSCDENCTGPGNKACLACKTGYSLVADEGCKDIDECAIGDVNCEDGKYCANTPGSYECTDCDKACSQCSGPGTEKCSACNSGYEMRDKGCEDVDECTNTKLCPGENEHCKNMPGFYSCVCDSGHTKKNGKCVKGKKKKKPKKSEDEIRLDDLKKGKFVEEWHLKMGSLLYAVFFALMLWAFSRRSASGVAALVVLYLSVLFALRRSTESED